MSKTESTCKKAWNCRSAQIHELLGMLTDCRKACRMDQTTTDKTPPAIADVRGCDITEQKFTVISRMIMIRSAGRTM